MKKLPYGISNYEEIIEDDYYYIDKTQYIEYLENLAEKRIMILRPRKFGKTLFTSILENYYDIKKKEKFEKLYKGTYIGKNPTKLRNSYYILRFNFSGINTENVETTIKGFKNEISGSIKLFVEKYDLDFYVDNNDDAEGIMNNLFKSFLLQKKDEKIYVIIDEYDHFANELLGFHTELFKDLVSKNGRIRKWYEILKEGTESVVDRIFITGVAPITLDSLTSGFNICSDKTLDRSFNEMLGFTKNEVVEMMKYLNIEEKEQNNILPILKDNYDGYKFSKKAKEKIYNSNMTLYFLNEYIKYNEIPDKLVDMNIASDYSKLGKMLDLCKSEKRLEILEKTISKEGVLTEITEKFNPEIDFTTQDFASLLFYLGYLTIEGEELGRTKLEIPNKIMKNIYSDYFLQKVNEQSNLQIDNEDYNEILREIALEGKINKIVELLQKYLNNLSNRDYIKFDEKYIKLIFYSISMNLNMFYVKSELEVNRNYPDLLLIPKERDKGYNSVMIEFKYLKKEEENKLEEKQKEAKEQIKKYSEYEEIKNIENLNKYTIIAVNDKIYVEKI